MSKTQLLNFKKKLLEWKSSIEQQIKHECEIETQIASNDAEEADENDAITRNNIISLQGQSIQKHLNTLKEINHALNKIENGSFGVCEETEEMIDIKRLLANPIARYSLEAQILLENNH